MLVSLIIVFREAMEAGLIVGIVLAATQGVARRGRWLAGGVGAGVLGAGLVAIFAAALSNAFDGIGQEIFTAGILLFAVAMLSWHVLWMSRHAREMTAELKQVGHAVRMGERTLAALASVVAVAVLREGAEVVLFLFGAAAATPSSAVSMVGGGVGGLGLAAALSWLLYRGLVAIPLRTLFRVTNWLIALLAAGMAGQAAAVLHGADLLPGWGEQMWDTSSFVEDGTLIGRTLHALVGYSARPSGVQIAAWAATLAALMLAGRMKSTQRAPVRRTATAALVALAVAAPFSATTAHAEDGLELTFQNHRFVPEQLTVPAGQKLRLTVKNNDDTPDEFESKQLNREKLVPAHGSATVFIGPLEPGSYAFSGDFHPDTAHGTIIAK